jgi:aldehyde dehydrogenase (NAD+)
MDWTLDLAERHDYERDIGVTRAMACRRDGWSPGTRWGRRGDHAEECARTNQSRQMRAALAAGCTVVLKAAPETPWSAALLGVAAAEAGLPAGVFNVITSADKTGAGAQLVADPRVDLSRSPARRHRQRILSGAAATVKRVFLELGGKSANIVLDDAEFPQALYSGLAVCYHAGQGCSITTRMLLPRSRYDEAIAILKQLFEHLPYGDPSSLEQILGR